MYSCAPTVIALRSVRAFWLNLPLNHLNAFAIQTGRSKCISIHQSFFCVRLPPFPRITHHPVISISITSPVFLLRVHNLSTSIDNVKRWKYNYFFRSISYHGFKAQRLPTLAASSFPARSGSPRSGYAACLSNCLQACFPATGAVLSRFASYRPDSAKELWLMALCSVVA